MTKFESDPAFRRGEAAIDIDALRRWIGREETRTDIVTAAPIAALAATLDRDDPPPQAGDAVPPLWHWLFFLHAARASEIGLDGHPTRGGFLPPVPLPRRMWAGGRLVFERPLRVGGAVTRTSRIADVSVKHGKGGPLVFVQVAHTITNSDGLLLLSEEHDIVYRDKPSPELTTPTQTTPTQATSTKRAPAEYAWSREIVPDPVLLFRYSALTFNGHRIHYDVKYVTDVEGYGGLIVHGPLIATLLADLLRRNLANARLTKFEFRAIKPLFDTAPFLVRGLPHGQRVALWAQDRDGDLCMEATAEIG